MRFLIVDDDPEYRRALRYHIEVEWPDALINEYQPQAAGQIPAGFSMSDVDVVLLGHPVGQEEGLYWLTTLTRRSDCPPVILFAADGDEFLAVEAIKSGAANYFPKARVRHRQLVEALREETGAGTGDTTSAVFAARPGLRGLKHHRFLAKLHSGDLASVYLAESEATQERLVFKVLRHVPDAGGGRLFDRFLQEYEVIAGIDHPNVVRIFDLGVADDHAYIAMEYLSEGSLAERLNRSLPRSQALQYGRQIAQALEAIHQAGVLHRDLKPANIMFRRDNSLALIDFGLAKKMRLEVAITGTGQIFGTPYYMSPEQGHAEPADQRSDIYSFGCILHEMLTGERPFVASTPMAVIYKHAHAPRPELPPELEDLQLPLDRMLAVDPEERYQSVAEVLEVLSGVD